MALKIARLMQAFDLDEGVAFECRYAQQVPMPAQFGRWLVCEYPVGSYQNSGTGDGKSTLFARRMQH